MTAALADYGQAIALGEELRQGFEAAGRPEWRVDLAFAYTLRGNVHSAQGALTAALADLSQAIALDEELRRALEPAGQWQPARAGALAFAYTLRGKVHSTQGALTAALADYGQAIALGEELRRALEPAGQWQPEWRNALVDAYRGRGEVRSDQEAFAAAIADHGQAIALGEELRRALEPAGQWQPAYRNALVDAYVLRGHAHSDQGALAAAVADLSQAIALGEELRRALEPAGQWQPAYRNALAGAYANRGHALSDQGAFTAALADLSQAIALGEELRRALEPAGQWRPAYRNALAAAYVLRGHAHSDQGALTAAVADLSQAIALGEEFRRALEPAGQWRPEWRNDLAAAYDLRGHALSDQGALTAAMADYETAIKLLEPLLGGSVADWFVPAVHPYADAHSGRARANLDLGNAASATDDADAALEKLQLLEQQGVFRWRKLRERVFGNAIEAYVQFGNPRVVGEVILEHLDPANPGAAPASEAMHRAALDGLRLTIEQALDTPNHEALLDELLAVAARLEEIRVLYFAGTAAAAWLRALDQERVAGVAAAEAILVDYTQARPDDAEGYLRLAEYRLRHDAPQPAAEAFLDAGGAVVAGGSADDTRLRLLADIAGKALRLKLAERLPAVPAADLDLAWEMSDELLSWLKWEFPNTVIAAGKGRRGFSEPLWREGLGPKLDEVWAQEKTFRSEFINRFQVATEDVARDKARAELWNTLRENTLAIAQAVGQALPIGWGGFAAAIEGAWIEILGYYESRDPEALQAKLREAIERAVRQHTERIDTSELAPFETAVATALGSQLWGILTETERRFLAAARRCQEEKRWRYAGLEIGLAVEHTLDQRVFRPFRGSAPLDLQAASQDFITANLIAFLRGERKHLMLGQMIGAFNRALSSSTADSITELLRSHLNDLPSGPQLFAIAPPVRKSRKDALNRINQVRIDCCHPKDPPLREDVEASWRAAVSEDPDAFFNYFVQALLPPAGSPHAAA